MKPVLKTLALSALLTVSGAVPNAGHASAEPIVSPLSIAPQSDRLSSLPLEPDQIAVIGSYVAAGPDRSAAEQDAVDLAVWSIRHPGYRYEPVNGTAAQSPASADAEAIARALRVTRFVSLDDPAGAMVLTIGLLGLGGWRWWRAQRQPTLMPRQSPRARGL